MGGSYRVVEGDGKSEWFDESRKVRYVALRKTVWSCSDFSEKCSSKLLLQNLDLHPGFLEEESYTFFKFFAILILGYCFSASSFGRAVNALAYAPEITYTPFAQIMFHVH